MLVRHQTRLAWLLILPMLVAVVLVAGYPLFQVIRFSLYSVDIARVHPPKWVGLGNYAELLQDPDFREALWNTVRFTAVSVFIETVLGLVVALVIHSQFAARGVVRAAILVPWAIPTVVSAQMWKWMLHDIYGFVNVVGVQFGLLSRKVAWLARPETAMGALIAVDVWKTTPFMALLLLAGLQLIPDELYEAARVDGASAWQQFLRITLPLLTPTLTVALVFRTLDALRVFDIVLVMTGGGNRTETLAVLNRRILIDFQDLGYGSAISVVILILILLFVGLYLHTVGRTLREN